MARCMILNDSYEFLAIIEDWMDALCLVLAGKATVMANYADIVRSQHLTFNLPAVLVMNRHVRTLRKRHLFDSPSRQAVLLRDGFLCQYCGTKLSMATGTRDHLIPVSRGGPDTLENVVASCRACNSRKADAMPHEVGMQPKRRPRRLTNEEKVAYLMKRCRIKEREVWLSCLERHGISLWAA